MAEDDKQHYESIEMLDRSFKRRLGRAKTEDEPAIREEWTQAKAAFHAEQAELKEAREQGEAAATELRDSAQRSEEEARAAARRAYGDSVSGSGAMKHVYADPPTPITVNPRPVEVIYSEEE